MDHRRSKTKLSRRAFRRAIAKRVRPLEARVEALEALAADQEERIMNGRLRIGALEAAMRGDAPDPYRPRPATLLPDDPT